MGYKIALPYLGSDYGGSYRSGILLARDLPSQFDPVLIFPHEGRASDIADGYGVEYEILNIEKRKLDSLQDAGKKSTPHQLIKGLKFSPILYKYKKHIDSNSYDLIHTNDSRTTLVWGAAARISRTPVVWHVRRENSSLIWDTFRAILSERAICVSNSTSEAFEPLSKLVSNTTIHNGVDFERVQRDSNKLNKMIGVSDNIDIIAYIGYLSNRKRPILFGETAISVLTQRQNTHAVMIGSDKENYSDQINKLVQDQDLSSRVHLLGYRDDVGELLDSIDILVFTSKGDGEAFPRVVIEAMASGTPVISTESAGVVEAIKSGSTGETVPPNIEPADFAEKIITLLNNKCVLEKYSINSVDRAEKEFSSRIVAEKISDIYLDILE